MTKQDYLYLDEEEAPARKWEEVQAGKDAYLRHMIGDYLMSLDTDESYYRTRPLWHWKPVSHLVRWVGDKPIFETPELDELEPDWAIQIVAARTYLDNLDKNVGTKDITPPVIVPIAVILILFALIGFTLLAMRTI